MDGWITFKKSMDLKILRGNADEHRQFNLNEFKFGVEKEKCRCDSGVG